MADATSQNPTGSASGTPTQVQQYNYGFAPELAPAAQDLIKNAGAFTDVNNNPYMQYQGERTAQFMPLQQQAFQNAALMQSSPQLQQGTAIAGEAGLGGLNTAYTYNPYQTQSFTSPGMAQSYMNPYIQNVMDVQTQQANRVNQIQNAANNAQATTAGAFGGGRQAIMGAQNNADLARNLAGIQATGLSNAYTQGQQQFNTEQGQAQNAAQLNAQQGQFGANLGLQGLNTAIQGAGMLGTLGQNQYTQNMGINQLQNATGTQQQQQVQTDINNKYQDYLNAQNYPYQQMGFMSSIIRGLPTSQTSSSVYQAPPSTAQTVASLGLGAAGLSKLFANGGHVQSYGLGGIALNQLGS
jgi:hypothetical protein